MKLQMEKNEDGSIVYMPSEIDTSPETDNLSQAQTDLARMEVFGMPFGTAFVGGLTATVASEVVGGVLGGLRLAGGNNILQALINGAVSVFVVDQLKRWTGKGPADAARLIITFDTLSEILPLDQLISGIFSGIPGLGQSSHANRVPNYSGADKLPQVVGQGQQITTLNQWIAAHSN